MFVYMYTVDESYMILTRSKNFNIISILVISKLTCLLTSLFGLKRIGGEMVSVLASSVVDHGFKSQVW